MQQQQINIKDLSITELKALGYDMLVTVENSQRNLSAINAEIATRNQQQPSNGVPAETTKTLEPIN